MSANLTPEYLKAEESYKQAKEPEEKLRYLEMMLSTIPKHKGTDKMQADIKRRISRTRESLEKRSKSRRYNPYQVEREGIAQIAVVGAPNAGKSCLVSALTNAKCQVAEYPYTTVKPTPGMMQFENVQMQLVDLPPVSEEFTEAAMVSMIRNADVVVLVFDASDPDPMAKIEEVRGVLREHKVFIHRDPERKFTPEGDAYLKGILLANKADADNARANLQEIGDLYGEEYPIHVVSAQRGDGVEELRRVIFDMLGVIRVYTKTRGKEPNFDEPVVLKQGATLLDFAAEIHKDFVKSMKYAKIWSKNTDKYDGQMVNRDEVMVDEDIIQLHI